MDISPAFWLALLTIGVLILGAAMIYATMRNRTRTPVEKAETEAATRREYASEDRDSR